LRLTYSPIVASPAPLGWLGGMWLIVRIAIFLDVSGRHGPLVCEGPESPIPPHPAPFRVTHRPHVSLRVHGTLGAGRLPSSAGSRRSCRTSEAPVIVLARESGAVVVQCARRGGRSWAFQVSCTANVGLSSHLRRPRLPALATRALQRCTPPRGGACDGGQLSCLPFFQRHNLFQSCDHAR
jgi:hypothetical protein